MITISTWTDEHGVKRRVADRIQYITLKGRKYKVDTHTRMIWAIIGSTAFPSERELKWMGPTACAVREQLNWEMLQEKLP